MVYKKIHYGLNALSKFLPEEAKKNLKKRGFFELELLKSWREIIGEDYYKLTKPNKIKKSQVSLRDTSTLQLKVDPTIAFAIEHDQTKIISKINGFFGYKAINKLEIIQERIDIDALRSNNNNKLNEEVNIASASTEEAADFSTKTVPAQADGKVTASSIGDKHNFASGTELSVESFAKGFYGKIFGIIIVVYHF